MTDNFERFRSFMQLPEEDGGDAYYTSKGFEIPDIKRNHLTLLYEAL